MAWKARFVTLLCGLVTLVFIVAPLWLDDNVESVLWKGTDDFEVAGNSDLSVDDVDMGELGMARVVSGSFRAGLTTFEKLKNSLLLAMHGRSRKYSVAEEISRTVVIMDHTKRSRWYSYARKVYREFLVKCSSWQETRSSSWKPVTAYSCADPEINTQEGQKASKLLDKFRADPGVGSALRNLFSVDAHSCVYLRPGALLSLQRFNMTPDSFHPDLCTGDQVPSSHLGLTVLVYPHDRWDVAWGGDFELQGPSRTPVARVSPMANRTVIFDGCIRHRATNAHMTSEPILKASRISASLRQLDANKYLGPLVEADHLMRSWRFALVLQIGCAWSREGGSSEDGERFHEDL